LNVRPLIAALAFVTLLAFSVSWWASEGEGPEALQAPVDALGAADQRAFSVEEDFRIARQQMIDTQLRRRGIDDPAVLAAMDEVPRHRFVPQAYVDDSYGDHPLPIGEGQTISQPYVVALMVQLLKPTGRERVLEVGTGSGYHAAVLSRTVSEVFSIEIVEPLGRRAAAVLEQLGYQNVHLRIGDGYEGWPEEAPFDAILLTAAPPRIPEPLLEQLAVGGRMVLPLGDFDQQLLVLTRTEDGFERQTVAPVRFVPMTGRVQEGTS
jgi:protein-L-isoaspartate(D-aspartate) O-methyltransferase